MYSLIKYKKNHNLISTRSNQQKYEGLRNSGYLFSIYIKNVI